MKPVVFGALFLMACSIARAQEYDLVRKYRPEVGATEAYGIRFTQEQTTRLKSSGKIVAGDHDKKIQMEMGGPKKTLEVDSAGHASKWKLTLKFFTYLLNGEKVPLFKKEDVLTFDEKGVQPCLVNDKPPSKDHEAMLNLLFPPKGAQEQDKSQDAGEPGSDDDGTLPGRKVKVGDTWPVKAERVNRLFAGMGLPVNIGAIHGTVTLESATPREGVSCLQTLAEISLDSKDIKDLASFPNYQGKKFFVLCRQRHNFPVDPTLPDVSNQTLVRLEIETAETTVVAGGKKEDVLTRLLTSTEISTAQLK